jgi:hypothetical protein
MLQLKQQLLDTLQQVKGSGKFVSIHTADFVFPGLKIDGFGEIPFPINTMQAKALIQLAHKAPFGKGGQTTYDGTVRSCWEIDADKLSLGNPAWTKFLNKAISNIKVDLGLEDSTIAAHLYKLLIYEEGDFFLSHKDTEKEKDMFGTLIVGLPSRYTGGELCVQFEGVKEVADFSQTAEKYLLNYAAFYADCDHEVKPLTSGYRVCLVYNLVQQKSGKKIGLQSIHTHATRLAEILTQKEVTEDTTPYIILLGHQYTPENFSYDALKLNDRAKAEALLQAAQKAGYYAKLCLVTSYLSGAPAYDGNYGYGDGGGDDDAEMEEVFDESLQIEHWAENQLPALNNITFEEADLITAFTLKDDEPIVKESTGYMGNYGPDLMHWYHYGAVMIWPPDVNARLLLSQNAATQLNWIDYFNRTQQISKAEISAVEFILTTGFSNNHRPEKETNFNPIADWLMFRNDTTFLIKLKTATLQLYFTEIDVDQWIKVFKFLPEQTTIAAFENLSEDITLAGLEKRLAVLRAMFADKDLRQLAIEQLKKLPVYFKILYTPDSRRVKSAALADLFWLEKNLSPQKNWTMEMVEILTTSQQRQYIHNVLGAQLLIVNESSKLTDKLLLYCQEYLQQRVNNPPQPPANWSRSLPETTNNKKEWKLLTTFLESPDERVFDYRKNQSERTAMEYAIKNVTIDLKTETIKKGSPHTLRITKTQTAYQRQLKEWHEDVALLEKVKLKNNALVPEQKK